jgi:hypothetical protein
MTKEFFYIRWNMDVSPKIITADEPQEDKIDDLTQAQEVLRKFTLNK